MKLKLAKQKITQLSTNDLNNINGGGNFWSDLRTGNCGYSGDNPDRQLLCDGGFKTISCIAQPYRMQKIQAKEQNF